MPLNSANVAGFPGNTGSNVNVIDLTAEHEPAYRLCLEEWSDEIREAGDHKRIWCGKMWDKGLRVKLAVDDRGTAGGMIQYVPIEHSFALGRDLHVVLCIWVHGHDEGRGNFQKRGMGKALLRAAEEEDARSLGSRGMVAWGLWIPVWMKASWFKRQGYTKVDRDGIRVLLWKPFTEDAEPPKWIRRRKRPEPVAGKVTVTAFTGGWCPAQNLVYERAKRAGAALGDAVVFREIGTSDREVLLEWGISDALFIDKKEVSTGPPPSYDKIHRLISRRVGRL